MKVLPINNIDSVAASSENANFPATNLLDEHPKRVSKAATGTTVTYTLGVDGAGDWFGLVNTNARTVSVKVYAVAPGDLSFGGDLFGADGDLFGADDDYFATTPVFEGEYSLGGIDTYAELIADSGQSAYEIEVAYPYQDSAHSIVVELDTATESDVAYAGLVRAGVAVNSTHDPQYGMTEGLIDYSIVKQLSNGATFVKQRDIVRTFSVTLFVRRDREFYDFMHGVFRQIGRQARLWKVTDLENNDWVVFGRLEQMPLATHQYYKHSTIPFTLVEVL